MDIYCENAMRELEGRKIKAQVLSKAWREVKRNKTKDGKDFKNLANNFTKGAIQPNRYNPSEKEIKVYAYHEKTGHISDEINISPTVYSNSDEAKRYEAEGRLQQRGEWLHPFIIMTPDEIEKAIQERVDYWDNLAKTLEQFLAGYDKVAEQIVALRVETEKFLKAQPIETYYVLRKALREGRD